MGCMYGYLARDVCGVALGWERGEKLILRELGVYEIEVSLGYLFLYMNFLVYH